MKVMDRRTVLRGAGGIAVALPFLSAMTVPRKARAAGVAKRFVTWFSANGTIPGSWQPTGTETAFVLPEILSPLEAHHDKLTILRGLNNEISYKSPGSNPHDLAMGTMLTGMPMRIGPSGLGRAGHIIDGTAGGASIDQDLAKRLSGKTKLAHLTLGVQSTSTILEPMVLKMSYRGPSDPVTPEDDPGKAFAALFGDTMTSQAELLKLRKRRTTVLDAVLDDYTRLMSRVPADDKSKLDRHATSIRELEKQLGMLDAGKNCHGAVPVAPTVTLTPRNCIQDGRPARCVGDFPTIGRAQMDVLVLALACDLTRVASLQWSTAESTVVHSWLGVTGEHHLMSHDVAKAPDLIKVNKWYSQQLAYLLDKMQAITDEEGTTLLDGSVVFWTNELSIGDTHNRKDLCFLLAGKGNGALRSGRSLRFNGTPHNQLLAALVSMYGTPIPGFGDPMFPGVLPGLG
ncbi:MAG TPA: DUF1552 domain-containing protein [Polyangia bacterium]|jgi:hypothetical protein|nr:DUF1552 domain-containing protein [Polyangia bacterium]